MAFSAIRNGLFYWDWSRVEEAFHAFCEAHREAIPLWFEDEYLFTGMKLWADGRPRELLRHFATFFERALGRAAFYTEADAETLAAAEPLL